MKGNGSVSAISRWDPIWPLWSPLRSSDVLGVGWVLRGRMVVYINPVTIGEERWDSYLVDMKAKLGNMEIVTNLVSCHLLFVPLFFKLNSLCSSSFLFCAIHPFPNCKISSHYFGFRSWFRILSSPAYEDLTGRP
jgi:hypothetical protein